MISDLVRARPLNHKSLITNHKSLIINGLGPFGDYGREPLVELICGSASSGERMIAAFHDFQRDARLHCANRLSQLGRRTEGVALALHDQHRNADRSEVRSAQLFRLSWWVKRIAEREYAGHLVCLRRKVGGDSTAHRLAAEEQRVWCARRLPGKRDDPPKAIFQNRRSVRHSSLLLHVREVERPGVDAGLCKLSRNACDEGMTLAGPCAVGKNDADVL